MRKSLIVSGIIIFLIVLFIITCPTNEDYKVWLKNEKGISCVEGETFGCTDGEKVLDWRSRSEKSYGPFMTIGEIYEDKDGNLISIEALGILNFFFEIP